MKEEKENSREIHPKALVNSDPNRLHIFNILPLWVSK